MHWVLDLGGHAIAKIPHVARGILREVQEIHRLPWCNDLRGIEAKHSLCGREDFDHSGVRFGELGPIKSVHCEGDVVHPRFVEHMNRVVVAANRAVREFPHVSLGVLAEVVKSHGKRRTAASFS